MRPRRLVPASLATALLAGTLLGSGLACRHLPAPPPALATAGSLHLTEDELQRWTPLLSRQRKIRRAQRELGEARAALLRQIALVQLVLEREQHDPVLPAGRQAVVRRDLADREVHRRYEQLVLLPQAEVSRDEARQIFERHRDGYQKPPGVRCLEIFCWAPTDLPELRRQRYRQLEELRATVDSAAAFQEAAWRLSDATSRTASGQIGSVLENQVGEPLRSALFGIDRGLTPIIESEDGLFLFWVSSRLPARDNRFEDVADGIVERLRRQRLEQLWSELTSRITAELALADPPPVDHHAPAARFQGQVLTLAELELDEAQPSRIRDRVVARSLRHRLTARGEAVPPPPPEQVQWRLFREIWPKMVAQWQEARSSAAADVTAVTPPAKGTGRPAERWTFDLLVIEGCTSQRELFQVFRCLHSLGPEAGLARVAEHLRQTYQTRPAIRHYDRVLAAEAAGLGPEIHTTLKRRLKPGERSRPMHLADRQQVVVVDFQARELDQEAAVAASQEAAARRATRTAEQELERHLLSSNGFILLDSDP